MQKKMTEINIIRKEQERMDGVYVLTKIESTFSMKMNVKEKEKQSVF